MSEKQKHPTAKKKSRAPNPLHEKKKDDPRKNHGDSECVQHLVRSGVVFVIVLCHVVRQAWHVAHLQAAGCGCQVARGDIHVHVDFIPNVQNFLESSGSTESPCAMVLPEWETSNRLAPRLIWYLQSPS